jgi:hypothetical protein
LLEVVLVRAKDKVLVATQMVKMDLMLGLVVQQLLVELKLLVEQEVLADLMVVVLVLLMADFYKAVKVQAVMLAAVEVAIGVVVAEWEIVEAALEHRAAVAQAITIRVL